MGDRGNVVIVQHPFADGGASGELYLYTHWGGSVIAGAVQCALVRGKDRWSDEVYLAQTVSLREEVGKPPKASYSFADFVKLDLVHEHLVDERYECATAQTAGTPTQLVPPSAPVRAPLDLRSHVAAATAGALLTLIVVGLVRLRRGG